MEIRLKRLFQSRYFWLVLGVSLFYWIIHLPQLTLLPIFADEAIYIRWAQLIIDDPARYLFFALNDGKTPLFIWSLVPLLKLPVDPLLVSRLLSVTGGFAQMLLLGWLAYRLKMHRAAVFLVMLFACLLPFWFFNSRLALMDTWLTVWLTLSLISTLAMVNSSSQVNETKTTLLTACKRLLRQPQVGRWLLILGVSVGLALWTKLSGVLWLPVLCIWPWYVAQTSRKNKISLLLIILTGIGLGLLGFALLKFVPGFSQLFSRGGDFLFSPEELLAQPLRNSIARVFSYPLPLLTYLTPFIVLSPVLGLLLKKGRRLQLFFLLSIVVYMLPIMVFGQVVYSRYLLPTAILLTLSGGLFFSSLIQQFQAVSLLWQKTLVALGISLLLANILSASSLMLVTSYTDLASLPLTTSDRTQYLTEWSAGFGTREVVDTLLKASKQQRIVVATEGYFGSLPDGLLVYLHNQSVKNIFVDGIGQPVESIPTEFKNKVVGSGGFDQAWLVVNSHRLRMDLDSNKLMASYCRPDNSPCLDVYDITAQMSQ